MKPNYMPRFAASGYSLIELMVAILISLIITGATILVFVNSKQSYSTTGGMARLQENARFAMGFLARDIRRAGNMGCIGDIANVESRLNGGGFGGGLPQQPFAGTEGCAATGVCSASDTLTLQYMDLDNSMAITQSMPNESAVLHVAPGHGLKQNQIIAVGDCSSMDLIQITNDPAALNTVVHNSGAGTPGNSTQKLSKSYEPGEAVIMTFRQYKYDIAPSPASGNQPALFRSGEELVGGIENFQVLYGIDATGDGVPNKYVSIVDVPSWNVVASIRIGILASTVADTEKGEYGTDIDTQTYSVNDTEIRPASQGAGDRRMRKAFVTTIALRNQR